MLAKRLNTHSYIHFIKPTFSYSITTYSKPTKSLVFFNTQISENGRNGNITAAESIFNRMPTKNIVSHTAMLTAYANNGRIYNARKVFDEMPERSVVSWNAMITAYNRSEGCVGEAWELFKVMPESNAVSYAAMITGFVRVGDMERAEEIYEEMPVVWRDPVCSNALISGYLKMGIVKSSLTKSHCLS